MFSHLLCSASPALCLFLCQVKNLEDEKKKLEYKLRILKDHENYKGKVDDIVRQEKNDLEQQIESLLRDQEKLQAELEISVNEKEDTKKRSDAHSGADFVLWFTHQASIISTYNNEKGFY